MEGDGGKLVWGAATLEQAGADMASWVGDVAFLPRVADSKAGVVLVPEDCTVPAGRTVIRVGDPSLAFCEALRCLGPPEEGVGQGIHPTATVSSDAAVEGACIGASVFVGPRAVIGSGTQLHPGVYVGAQAKIGRDGVLWPNVVVRERVTIGDRVIIHPNTTIGADGFGYLQRDGKHRKIPQIGAVVIEDDVEIGANSAIDRARTGVTRVGRGTKIDNLVQVAHNVDIGEDCIIAGQCGIAGSTTLGHHVVMAGNAGVSDHLRVGSGVRAAVRCLVLHDVPDGQAVGGTPAIDHRLFLRQQVSLGKLPKWMQRLREMEKRIRILEGQRPEGPDPTE